MPSPAPPSEITFLPLGAILQALPVAGHNIVLGFATQADYVATGNPAHFGATIGRVANRVAGARIAALNNNRAYALAANDPPNSLHGGPRGWGTRLWAGPEPLGAAPGREVVPGDWEPGRLSAGGERTRFRLTSQDGDEGFPGTVEASVVYTTGTRIEEGKEVTVLGIEYEATLVGGADETVVSMTNHSYFNLSPAAPTIANTTLRVATAAHLPLDPTGIPTSTTPVPSPHVAPGGLAHPITLGATAPAIDDCFVLDPAALAATPLDTRALLPPRLLVAARHPDTALCLEVWSTEPAFQLYTGAGIDVPAIGGLPARGPRAGFCVEPGRCVNAVNVPEWRRQVVLKRGETYGARIVYRAWKE